MHSTLTWKCNYFGFFFPNIERLSSWKLYNLQATNSGPLIPEILFLFGTKLPCIQTLIKYANTQKSKCRYSKNISNDFYFLSAKRGNHNMAFQDKTIISTFEKKPRRQNISDYEVLCKLLPKPNLVYNEGRGQSR